MTFREESLVIYNSLQKTNNPDTVFLFLTSNYTSKAEVDFKYEMDDIDYQKKLTSLNILQEITFFLSLSCNSSTIENLIIKAIDTSLTTCA